MGYASIVTAGLASCRGVNKALGFSTPTSAPGTASNAMFSLGEIIVLTVAAAWAFGECGRPAAAVAAPPPQQFKP